MANIVLPVPGGPYSRTPFGGPVRLPHTTSHGKIEVAAARLRQ